MRKYNRYNYEIVNKEVEKLEMLENKFEHGEGLSDREFKIYDNLRKKYGNPKLPEYPSFL